MCARACHWAEYSRFDALQFTTGLSESAPSLSNVQIAIDKSATTTTSSVDNITGDQCVLKTVCSQQLLSIHALQQANAELRAAVSEHRGWTLYTAWPGFGNHGLWAWISWCYQCSNFDVRRDLCVCLCSELEWKHIPRVLVSLVYAAMLITRVHRTVIIQFLHWLVSRALHSGYSFCSLPRC